MEEILQPPKEVMAGTIPKDRWIFATRKMVHSRGFGEHQQPYNAGHGTLS